MLCCGLLSVALSGCGKQESSEKTASTNTAEDTNQKSVQSTPSVTATNVAPTKPSKPSTPQRTAAKNNPPRQASQSQPPVRGDGPMLFMAQPKVDFGTISDLDEMTAQVPFMNNGSRVLEIVRVQPTCGCTTTKLEQTLFAPGEGDTIELKFKPKTAGRQSKIVKVHTNDPRNPIQNITITANVKGSVTVTPRSLSFGVVPLDSGTQRQVVLTADNETYAPQSVSFFGQLAPYASGELRRQPNANGKPSWRIEVILKPNIPWGWYTGSMRIKGTIIPQGETEPKEKLITVGMNASLQGDLRATDTLFRLLVLQPNQDIRKSIELSHAQQKPFQILEAEVAQSNNSTLQLAVTPVAGSNGSAYTLTLMGKTGDTNGSVSGRVVVKTDIPGEEEVEIRVVGSVRKPNS